GPCSTLFTNAESAGSTGTAPTDTATAAINIAHNPAANVAELYGLSTANPPFGGGLTAEPNDFVVAIELSGGGSFSSWKVALDGLGNAWVTDSNSVSEFSSTGAALSPSSGYASGAFPPSPVLIAVDTVGNVWVMDGDVGGGTQSGGLTELSNSGTVLRNLNASVYPHDQLGCIQGDPDG